MGILELAVAAVISLATAVFKSVSAGLREAPAFVRAALVILLAAVAAVAIYGIATAVGTLLKTAILIALVAMGMHALAKATVGK